MVATVTGSVGEVGGVDQQKDNLPSRYQLTFYVDKLRESERLRNLPSSLDLNPGSLILEASSYQIMKLPFWSVSLCTLPLWTGCL